MERQAKEAMVDQGVTVTAAAAAVQERLAKVD
jgi:hypothetical protein